MEDVKVSIEENISAVLLEGIKADRLAMKEGETLRALALCAKQIVAEDGTPGEMTLCLLSDNADTDMLDTVLWNLLHQNPKTLARFSAIATEAMMKGLQEEADTLNVA